MAERDFPRGADRATFSESSENGSYDKPWAPTVNFQIRKMPSAQNIVGTQLKTLRREQGLTQAMLAARCGRLGWDIGENTVTKIETHVRCVTDFEIVCIAKALDVSPEALLPPKEKMKSVIESFFQGADSE